MRVDKWLWAARFFKTRGLAQQAIASGAVRLGGDRIKASHGLKVADLLAIRVGDLEWVVVVKNLSDKRGPAVEARKLYQETEESRAERERRMAQRRFEPASTIKGRPTKRDRRRLEELSNLPDES